MVKRGPKPKSLIDLSWRSDLAYVIGLLAADGYLSKDGLLVDLTSKDKEQLNNFAKCLNLKTTIGIKKNPKGEVSFRIQIKNRIFYDFLLSIGLTPKKSLTIGKLLIPKKYFFDFLRGLFDGDGSFYSYWDKRWRSSHMFYLEFISGSRKHIDWLRDEIKNRLNISGHVSVYKNSTAVQLKYARKEALVLIKKMYYNPSNVYLSRKKIKIDKALKIETSHQEKYK